MSAPISEETKATVVVSRTHEPQRWPVTKYSLLSGPTGEKFEFVSSFRTPGPDPKFRFVWTLAPGKRGPGLHVHEQETETFEIVSGTLRIWIEGVPKDYVRGDFVSIPPMVRHRFLNPTKEPAVVNVSLSGAKLEDAFIPVTVDAYPGNMKMKHFVKMTMLLAAESPPSTPQIKVERWIGLAVVWVFKLFGVKAYEPLTGWDVDQT